MPFWAPVFEEAKWAVRALLPIRSPLEVGWSLNFRDGMGTSYGCLLWLRHVLEAEVETRGMARAVLSWPHFLDDRRGALARVGKQLGLTWPGWCESALEEIDEFVTADLRHQKAEDDDLHQHPAISDLVRETYEAMLELVQDPANGCVLRGIDDLRARFESAAAVFDPPCASWKRRFDAYSHRPPRGEANLRANLQTPKARVTPTQSLSLRPLLTSPIDLRKRAAFQKETDFAAR
jgi:hypothetical protein